MRGEKAEGAKALVTAATGNASSTIMCDCEAGLDRYVGPDTNDPLNTPDGRIGAVITPSFDWSSATTDPSWKLAWRAKLTAIACHRSVISPNTAVPRTPRAHAAYMARVFREAGIAAVDGADRVVVLRAGLHLEDGATRLDLDAAKAHQHGDRRRRQLAREDRPDVVDPGELAAPRGERERVVAEAGRAKVIDLSHARRPGRMRAGNGTWWTPGGKGPKPWR